MTADYRIGGGNAVKARNSLGWTGSDSARQNARNVSITLNWSSGGRQTAWGTPSTDGRGIPLTSDRGCTGQAVRR